MGAPPRRFRKLLPLLALLPLLGVLPGLVQEAEDGFGRELRAAHRAFADGRHAEAAAGFERSLQLRPDSPHALYGRAIALMAMGSDEAALEAFDRAVAGFLGSSAQVKEEDERRALAVTLANRGLLRDRQGRHREALEDYRRALRLDSALADGPGWVTRFLRNQPVRPPGIGDRAAYLERQLALPDSERRLRQSELDRRQRPFRL